MPMLITDRTRLRQILGNLVSNAVKYTAGGTVTLRAREQAGEDGARRLLIEVSDTGAGIAPHRVRLLFQEFVRLDPTASPGVGIGLAISQRIARVLGGDIAVRSEVGKGTTFTLMIPIVLAAAPAAEAAIA
jgi:signal transduction histidine kinase